VNGFEVESVQFVDVSLIYRLAKPLTRIRAQVCWNTHHQIDGGSVQIIFSSLGASASSRVC